jgi:hypothetical protein
MAEVVVEIGCGDEKESTHRHTQRGRGFEGLLRTKEGEILSIGPSQVKRAGGLGVPEFGVCFSG